MILGTGFQVRAPLSPLPCAYTFSAINTARGWMRAHLSDVSSPSLRTISLARQFAGCGILRHALFSANLALDLSFAELIRAGQHPAEDRFVFAARRLRV